MDKCSCGSGLKSDRCCHGDSMHSFICHDCGIEFSSTEKHVIQIGNSSKRAKNKRLSMCAECSEKRCPMTFQDLFVKKEIDGNENIYKKNRG